MGYSVELYFDRVSERIIESHLNINKDKSISNVDLGLNFKPHISIAVYKDSLSAQKLMEKLTSFRVDRFKLMLTYVGFFCSDYNTIFLCPTITQRLLRLHDHFHSEFIDFKDDLIDYYLPNNWIPHCTISEETNNEDFFKNIRSIKEKFKPIEIEIDRIAFVKFRPKEIIKMIEI